MTVDYLDLRHEELNTEILQAVEKILHHGQFVLGPEVETFEKKFAEYIGVDYAVGVASGTDALVLALKSLQVTGKEVITVANPFVACVSSIILAGGKPVLVDVRGDLNMDPEKFEEAISDNTRAVLVPHLTGRPAPMGMICNIAEDRGVYVIEDCSQAIGAKYRDSMVGTFGDIACFSLHPTKNLGACGDAGVIVTQDEGTAQWLRQARNHGLLNRDNCSFFSLNSRLDTLQAAILSVKLNYLDEWNNERRRLARIYQSQLQRIVTVHKDKKYEHSVFHLYMIRCDQRDELCLFLQNKGIDCRIHYPKPIHLQDAGRKLGYKEGDLPMTENLSRCVLSLPIYPGMSEKDQQKVIQEIQNFYV